MAKASEARSVLVERSIAERVAGLESIKGEHASATIFRCLESIAAIVVGTTADTGSALPSQPKMRARNRQAVRNAPKRVRPASKRRTESSCSNVQRDRFCDGTEAESCGIMDQPDTDEDSAGCGRCRILPILRFCGLDSTPPPQIPSGSPKKRKRGIQAEFCDENLAVFHVIMLRTV